METKNILKELRKERNLSAQNVADGCQMSLGVYKKYESGERGVGTPALVKLADFYNVSTDYLLGRPDAKPPKSPIDTFAKSANLKELEKLLIKEYLKLSDKQRSSVIDFMEKIIKAEEERKLAELEVIDNEKDTAEETEVFNDKSQKTHKVWSAARSANHTPPSMIEMTDEDLQKLYDAPGVECDEDL